MSSPVWVGRQPARLEEQKMVFPLYVKAQTLLKSEFTPKIILSEDPKGLERNRLGELSDFFNDICTRCGMEFSSNSLDIKSLNKDSDVVSMEMILAGDLFSFREFLIQTMKLPFFDQIETIRISTENELKTFQTKIRIRIEKI